MTTLNVQEIKDQVCRTIDENSELIIQFAQTVEKHPELGFKETRTAAATVDFLKKFGFSCREGLALTGVKTSLSPGAPGPNIAVLGELDAVLCPDSPLADPLSGASHACGHFLQLAGMLGVAIGLKKSGVADLLGGNVTFMAVPAEEFIDIAYRQQLRAAGKIHFLGGKQELIFQGEFDDVDIAIMFHSQKDSPAPSVLIGESSNGFIAKTIQYIGRESHAGEAPDNGINALNAAMIGLMGIHALRETFREKDVVRVHPIITKGGDLVNTVPADVRMETYVRAKTMAAIEATHGKVDRALKAGGDSVGAQTIIHTIPGYLPLSCPNQLNDIFTQNALQFLAPEHIINAGHFGGSTDMGDVSHIIPSIHPYVGGIIGALHTKEFRVADYSAACILPAKLMAMTIIDLLANNAKHANSIKTSFRPILTKGQYISQLNTFFS